MLWNIYYEYIRGYSALAKQFSDEGIRNFRRDRTGKPRLPESGLREERPTSRKASASESRATGFYPRGCLRACPNPSVLSATHPKQELHMR